MPVRWRLTLFNALIISAGRMALGLSLFLPLREALLSGTEETTRSRADTAARALESGEDPFKDEDDVKQLTADGVFLAVRTPGARSSTRQPTRR